MSDERPDLALPTRFERSQTLPIYWYNKASDLRGAAGLVWAGMENRDQPATARSLGLGKGFSFSVACWPVYVMLCGLALELLLKAAIVQQGKKSPLSHRLEQLWRQVGLPVTAKQAGLLKILSEGVYWAGRYPVPERREEFDKFDKLSQEFLWDKVGELAPDLEIRRRNSALTWSSFEELWATAHASPSIAAVFEPSSRSPSAKAT